MSTKNPADYGTTVVKPADFDHFWAEILEQADRVPLNATLTPAPLRSTPTVEVFEVQYDSLDNVRIAGWYCLPRQRHTPLPAMVFYPGYISEQMWLQAFHRLSTGTAPVCCSRSL